MNRLLLLLLASLLPMAPLWAQSKAMNGLGQAVESRAIEPRTVESRAIEPRAAETTSEAAPHATKAAQSPFYVKVSGLYGLLTPGKQIRFSESLNQQGTLYPFKTSRKGLGGGPRAGIGVGFILNDFINLGVDADLLFGAPVKATTGYNDDFARSTTTSTTTLKVVSLIPNITLKALSRPAFYIYNRLGLVGGKVLDYKTVTQTVNLLSNNEITRSGTTSNYTKNGLAIGYQAALGIQFRLSQALRGFAEVVAYNQSFKPKTLEYTPAAVNGKSTPVQVTEFVDEGIEIPLINPTTRKPQTAQTRSFTVPMNSVGIGAGLTFRF